MLGTGGVWDSGTFSGEKSHCHQCGDSKLSFSFEWDVRTL